MAEQATRIMLVRHAVNDWIGSGKLPGRTPGIHLNDRGRDEAHALAERLVGTPLAAIYSSPLERAQETARIVAERLGMQVKTIDGLNEVDCGDWAGGVIEELTKTDLWRQIQLSPSTFRFPGGETMLGVQCRSVAGLETLRLAHPGETILVVSHADVIKVVIAYYMGMPLDLFQRVTVNPASITEFAFVGLGHRLLRCNDCAHIPSEPEKEPAQGESLAQARSDKEKGD